MIETRTYDEAQTRFAESRTRLIDAIAQCRSPGYRQVEAAVVDKLLSRMATRMRRRPMEVQALATELTANFGNFEAAVTEIWSRTGWLMAETVVESSRILVQGVGDHFDRVKARLDAITDGLLNRRVGNRIDPWAQSEAAARAVVDGKVAALLDETEPMVRATAIVIEMHCDKIAGFVGQRLTRSPRDLAGDLVDAAKEIKDKEIIDALLALLQWSTIGKAVNGFIKVMRLLKGEVSVKPSGSDELIVLKSIVDVEARALVNLLARLDRTEKALAALKSGAAQVPASSLDRVA